MVEKTAKKAGEKLEKMTIKDSDDEVQPCQDDRTIWQSPFYWDSVIDLTNKEVFKNEMFREN